MPSWIPGSYLLREYARQVVAIAATSRGRPVDLAKVDKSSWQCTGAVDELTIQATVYALDESVRGAFLDRRRGYFNGPCLFLAVAGREHEDVELTIEPPADPVAAGWRVATAMRAAAVDARGFGSYVAADYDELLDHPFEVSAYASASFTAGGVEHAIVIAGRSDTDLERIGADLRRLCQTHIDFFGAAPHDRYVFLGLAVGDGYGGLEHRASSSLIFNRTDLPKPGEPGVPRSYQRFLALASHEYFHTWHVKRTKPAAFMPYRLDRRNHTRLLWVFEGITTYYQDLLLLRSGLIGSAAYLQRLGEVLTRVYRVPGRRYQSIAASSFDAWDSLYKPEPNSPNSGISYYSKGALVALALDVTLRSQSPPRSLDEVVIELWRRYGARNVGVPEDGFESLAAEIGGAPLRDFFDAAVRGTEDLPLARLLAGCGVRLDLHPAIGQGDVGGTPLPKDVPAPVALGATCRARDGGLELMAVSEDGPAQRAGLNPGDVLIALDGFRVSERTLKDQLARAAPGAALSLTAFRGDELIEAEIVPAAAPHDTCYLELDASADSAALARRRAWLGD